MLPYALSSYHYHLPQELIAQTPSPVRDESRLLAIDRGSGSLSHHRFSELTDLLMPSDLLVLNETRVIPAALNATKSTGGRVELLVLQPAERASLNGGDRTFRTCMVRSSKPLKPRGRITLDSGPVLTVESVPVAGRAVIGFPAPEHEFLSFLETHGQAPLPPYVRSNGRDDQSERSRYQTVFARVPGSVAAPTAGLHFTESLLTALDSRGIRSTRIVLHVGPGTFVPVREPDIRRHRMESEVYEIPEAAAEELERARGEGRRIIAVGTTSVRAVESAALPEGGFRKGPQATDLFIFPGYDFKVVTGLVTNFHLPESTLLMLVCAFGGIERILNAYRVAVEERYRFYSYGDACLIL